MFTTKKDVDQHVRSALVKLKSENEKKLRGFTIAKLYYKISEYETARHYISNYLSVREDFAPAHKLLGQCYQQLKKPQKALESFQRSLQLDPKQPDLLIEVCKLLLADNSISANKAKFWCDLAESEKIQHDAVFSLRLKFLNQDGMENKQVEELILKEIASRPNDPSLKVRLVKYFIEQNKILEAFKYAFDQELKYHDLFSNCAEWYNVVWLALDKCKQQNRSWEFWMLLIVCLERQVELSFSVIDGSLTETANLLFSLDQYLFEASQIAHSLFPEKEFAEGFLNHFKGQLCLHAASLIFKREQMQNKNQWKESTKNALPLLLFAFQSSTSDIQEPWLKHCNDKTKQLIQLWSREGAFRCSQAGRILLSCIRGDLKENSSVSSQVHQIITEKSFWANSDDLFSQVRSFCSDTSWRNKIFRILFANSDQIRKMSTSFLINSKDLTELKYELPSYADVESYEEIAQYLRPQSLQHMVYLCLGLENLSDVRCKYFSGLNFSTQNLSFCGSESLNLLDVETFLYATVIQSKRLLEIERVHSESYSSINIGKPTILPFVNMTGNLSTEEQNNWWTCAYQVYRNLVGGENLGEIRATLQYGIEAVRGINGPKMDLVIALKLGKIFMERSQDATKPLEKNYLEVRTEVLYKHALNVYKLHNKGILEPFRKLFKYNNSSNPNVESEIIELAEEALTYLAARYFKNAEYEECIEEFSGIQLPFATYFQAEAYKKLDESNKTPKKTKKLYLDKARDCLNQTVNLLNFPNISSNHPLNSIIHSEIKRLQFIRQISSENINNGNFSAHNNRGEFYNSADENSTFYGYGNVSRREIPQTAKLLELENLVKQVATTLAFVKEELVDMIKPEVKDTRRELVEFKNGIKTELNELRDKLILIEENMKKKSQTPSRDDASNVLEDLYLNGDELLNQVYSNQSNLYSGYVQPQPSTVAQRIHTPNTLPVTHHPPLHHPQSTNPWYPTEYFAPPQYLSYPTVADRQHSSFNRLSFPDVTNATALNFNMPPTAPTASTPHQQPIPSQQLDSRTNLFGMMTNQQPQLTNTQIAVNKYPDKSSMQPISTVKNTSAFWNRVYNNAPVEKGPPVNVVITSSDPLPTTNAGVFAQQPPLSVTIPPQHIKSSFISNDVINPTGSSIRQIHSNTNFPIITQSFSTIPTNLISTIPNEMSSSSSLISSSTIVNEIDLSSTSKHSELPSALNRSAESNEDNELINKSNENSVEYDPRPDFKPIIPLPAEIEVKTGEENEDVLFSSRAKLLRHIDKEWKDRGIGDIKILKNKDDGRTRILMRRDQTHKICANHFITGEMNLIQAKNEEKSYIWAAKDYADEVEISEKLCVRFKQVDVAKKFYDVFTKARDEMKELNLENTEHDKNKMDSIPTTTTHALIKSSTLFNVNNNAAQMQKSNSESISTSSAIRTNTVTTASSVSLFGPPKPIFTMTSEGDGKVDDSSKNVANKLSPFAGFTFDNKKISNSTTTDTNKPFANLFTNLTTSKPQSSDNNDTQSKSFNIFSNTTAITTAQNLANTTNNAENNKDNTSNVLNKPNSNEDDDFVPTAEFKPVIPLPDLVEVQTGEENEIVLFEHRAKLFRYDKLTNQWKEKGIGNIKLLVEKSDPNRVRLLMRREQVLKVCINLRLTKTITFKPSPNTETAIQFGGKDYSDENNGKLELFTIRFKTSEICKSFHEAVVKAQQNMTEETIEDNIEMNQEKNNTTRDAAAKIDTNNPQQQKGFGDLFKPKPGSWACNGCLVSNAPETLYCVACDTPKDDTVPKKTPKNIFEVSDKSKSSNHTTFTFGFGSLNKTSGINETPKDITTTTATATNEGFGDKFKPKLGSWSCKSCYLSNEENVLYCIACDTPKDDTVPKKNAVQLKNTFNSLTAAPTFTFGFGSLNKTAGINESSKDITTSAITTTTAGAINESFGDKFKPKSGSWSCKACYLSNEENVLYCIACNTPKDDTVPNKDAVQLKNTFNSMTAPTFTFDLQNTVVKPFETAAVDLTKQQSFKFGEFSNVGSEFSFEPKKTSISGESSVTSTVTATGSFNTFSFSTTPTIFSGGVNNVPTPIASTVDNKITAVPPTLSSKPVFSFSMPPKPNTNTAEQQSSSDNNEFKLEKKEFSFILKPKSPGKTKSPLKNNVSGTEEESDNENVEEESNAYFTPAIPLPDKIEVKTGEEDEEVLYCHRAKLYKFSNSEWKERGLGDVKILKHKETKKLRVVMRREQVLKICLNHVLTNEVEYMRKDDKSWHFIVKDFSEGELELTQFCIRFKTKEIAEEFMNAIKKAIANDNEAVTKEDKAEKSKNSDNEGTGNSNESSKNEQELAEKLQLPLNFFEAIKNHENCEGCRGCDPEKFVFPEYDKDESNKKEGNDEEEKPLPLDMSGLDFNKKISSNTSILKESSFLLSQQNSVVQKPKESEGKNENKSIFDGTGSNMSPFGNKSTNVFSLGDNINLFGSATSFNLIGQKSIFGGNSMPSNTSVKTPEATSTPTIFGGGMLAKPLATTTTNDSSEQKQEQKTIFGGFSLGNLTNTYNSQYTFGNKGFETGKILATQLPPTAAAGAAEVPTNNKENDEEKTTNNIFKDPGISFSDLATMSSNFKLADTPQNCTSRPAGGFIGLTQNDAFRNFSNPEYRNTNDKSNSTTVKESSNLNNSQDGAAINNTNDESNYDPHYDPIIELPSEIEVVTGEENEEKLFGERATLFRYDSETKQWKERGVGELKILYHPVQGTYRLILRRERVYKLVLNHAISDDFSMKPMNNSGKAFCWAAQNYAEEPAAWEKLACRFKNIEICQRFETEVHKCIEQLKKRADLEPEED